MVERSSYITCKAISPSTLCFSLALVKDPSDKRNATAFFGGSDVMHGENRSRRVMVSCLLRVQREEGDRRMIRRLRPFGVRWKVKSWPCEEASIQCSQIAVPQGEDWVVTLEVGFSCREDRLEGLPEETTSKRRGEGPTEKASIRCGWHCDGCLVIRERGEKLEQYMYMF